MHKNIKKIEGKPTREDIKKVLLKIQENAAAVPSELGGGSHGYLGLTIVEVEYLTVAIEAFEPTENPGTVPTILENATQHQIAYAKEEYKKKLELFKEQRFVARALKSQVINAFDKTHLLDIKQDHVGYNNISIPKIFDHLFTNYGKIIDTDLLANKEAMNKSWDPDTPVQVAYKQVEDGVKYAKLAGVVTQDKEKIAVGYNLIHKIGELSEACRDWHEKS